MAHTTRFTIGGKVTVRSEGDPYDGREGGVSFILELGTEKKVVVGVGFPSKVDPSFMDIICYSDEDLEVDPQVWVVYGDDGDEDWVRSIHKTKSGAMTASEAYNKASENIKYTVEPKPVLD